MVFGSIVLMTTLHSFFWATIRKCKFTMPSTGDFTTTSLMTFIFLGIIRGTFSVVIHFAVKAFQSPNLVFLLRTPGTVVLYVIWMIFLSFKDEEYRRTFSINFCTLKNYWKTAIMGFVQLFAPYVLFMQGLKVLNPTVGGVFMAAAPWFTVLLERLPFIQLRSPLAREKLIAMIIGFVGIVLVTVAGVAHVTDVTCHISNPTTLTPSTTNRTSNNVTTTTAYSTTLMPSTDSLICQPHTQADVALSVLALIGGCVMWSISSVFWRSKRGDIHYVSSGVCNNMFGGMCALLFWLMFQGFNKTDKVFWHDKLGIFSIVFLTVVSGWLAAVMVDYLYTEIGATATNKALCLVPLVAWIEDWIFVRQFAFSQSTATWVIVSEIVGLVLVFVGLLLSSIDPSVYRSSLQNPLLGPSEEEEPDRLEINVRDTEDGMTSEEEVSVVESSRSSFPPLVEVRSGES